MTALYLSAYLLITYMYHGRESQSVSLSRFQGLLALIYKHKTSLGISCVPEKKNHGCQAMNHMNWF